MSFGSECVVIAFWGGEYMDRYHVSGRAGAWRLVRRLLMQGYEVGFSTALIEEMRR